MLEVGDLVVLVHRRKVQFDDGEHLCCPVGELGIVSRTSGGDATITHGYGSSSRWYRVNSNSWRLLDTTTLTPAQLEASVRLKLRLSTGEAVT